MSEEEDTRICIHPPEGRDLSEFNPQVLHTTISKVLTAAPGFLDLLALVEVPLDLTAERHYQIIVMEELVVHDDSSDCTWVALQMFLNWLHRDDDFVVTELNGEHLSLDQVLQFACAIRATDYEACIRDDIALLEIEEDALSLRFRENSVDSLVEIHTTVGAFEVIQTEEEHAEKEFRQYHHIESPSSESDSEWTKALP